MATEKAAKRSGWERFMLKYESYRGKNIVNIIYSAGASVVIIGALFKILHWPAAHIVLMVGMFTEAFLFLLGTLERPHPEFHWENVFPQLLEYGTKPELLEEKSRQPRPSLLGAGVVGDPDLQTTVGTTVDPGQTGRREPAAKVPTLKDEDLKALKEGIEDLAKTASQFSELSKVAQTGVKLNEKLAAAEVATDAYTTATAGLTQSYAQATEGLQHVTAEVKNVADEMAHVTEGTRAYKAEVESVGKNLASLNSLYELQLQAVNAQMEAQKAATEAQQVATEAAKEAAAAQQAYTAGAKQLQKQIADLNGIYGNMLNALA